MASRRKLYRRHGLPLSRGVDRDGTFYCPLVLRYVRFFSAEEILSWLQRGVQESLIC